jgi:hypothetical protein
MEGGHRPDEHARLGDVPLRESIEVPFHRGHKDVALRAVERADARAVRREAGVAPGVEERERERAGQARRLQVRRRRLSPRVR